MRGDALLAPPISSRGAKVANSESDGPSTRLFFKPPDSEVKMSHGNPRNLGSFETPLEESEFSLMKS
jgi:hypothetical protein